MLVSDSVLAGRRIIVGVSGGIAAYKSAELVRRLRQSGAEVRVVMTSGAKAFITPLTMQALSGNVVYGDLMDPSAEAAMGHIELARWADAVLIAPASANLLARMANGMADDLLSTLCLATQAPMFVAPAMNHAMWNNEATQANIERLQQRGVKMLGPAVGEQACGENGMGRMLEPDELVALLRRHWQNGELSGYHVLVSAGPTREAIDPVRYISNRSSGKMGYAVAEAAVQAGASVVLVSGPVALSAPKGVTLVVVETAAQMSQAVQQAAISSDIFVSVAAVADYRPSGVADRKIKKQSSSMTIALEPTDDILAQVAGCDHAPFMVGFAAETHNLEQHAKDKLIRKGVNMVAANLVGEGLGFDTDENSLSIFWQGGSKKIERANKTVVAQQLISVIAERYHAQTSN